MPSSKSWKNQRPGCSAGLVVRPEYGRVFAPVLHDLRLNAETVAVVIVSAPMVDLDPREARERRPRNPQKSTADKGKDMSDESSRPARPAADPATVAAEAEKFLQGLTTAFGVSGQTSTVIDGGEIDVSLDGNDLGLLVGPRGSTLQAVQDITRVVSQRRMGDHDTRLRVDVGGYRAKRKEALSRFVNQVADEVVASGTARALEPMPSPDRKVIHDALTGRTDIATHSEGEDPYRRVIIAPAEAPSA